jgi:hypothetical protein
LRAVKEEGVKMGIFDLFKPDVKKMERKKDIKGLTKALEYKLSSKVRSNAARSLGRVGGESVRNHLIQALKDKDPDVRWFARDALRMIGDGEVIHEIPKHKIPGQEKRLERRPIEAIQRLEKEADLFPNNKQASMRLFRVLIDCPSETQPKSSWPAPLTDVINCGEEAVEMLANGLEGDQYVPTGRKLYFALALCYIRSPKIAKPLCDFLEENLMMTIWPGKMKGVIPNFLKGRLVVYDVFETVYICIARALYWIQATSILPRLRAILHQSTQKKNSMLNALPYALRAIGFLGTKEDIPLVEKFLSFSCPDFDMSEFRVKNEAKHALYALRHPEEREKRANSHSDAWQSEMGDREEETLPGQKGKSPAIVIRPYKVKYCRKCRSEPPHIMTSVQRKRLQADLCPICEGKLVEIEKMGSFYS